MFLLIYCLYKNKKIFFVFLHKVFNNIYRMTYNLKFTDIIGNILYNHKLLLNKIYRMTSNIKFYWHHREHTVQPQHTALTISTEWHIILSLLTSSRTYCTTTTYCLTISTEWHIILSLLTSSGTYCTTTTYCLKTLCKENRKIMNLAKTNK